MFIYIKQLFRIIGKDTSKFPLLIILFIILSLLEITGIGLIGPYIGLLTNLDSLNNIFKKIIIYFNLSNQREELLIYTGLLLVAIFSIKSIFSIAIYAYVINFSFVHRQVCQV